MRLKLAISGKGGVGKSTLAGTLARLLAEDGQRVLAVDADPDANLASALGLPESLRRTVRTIAEERQLIEERTGAKAREFGQVFRLNPDVTGIAERYGTHFRGTDLLVLGAAQTAGGGCACPEGVLLKSLVRHLVLQRDEVVILDMEAGIEHLGRGTAMGVDLILVVVEPGKITEAGIDHDAGKITLKLVQRSGGEAAADTHWIVYNAVGEVIKERAGAFPTHVLAAGDYRVAAQHGDQQYAGAFTVAAGDAKLVEVLMQ